MTPLMTQSCLVQILELRGEVRGCTGNGDVLVTTWGTDLDRSRGAIVTFHASHNFLLTSPWNWHLFVSLRHRASGFVGFPFPSGPLTEKVEVPYLSTHLSTGVTRRHERGGCIFVISVPLPRTCRNRILRADHRRFSSSPPSPSFMSFTKQGSRQAVVLLIELFFRTHFIFQHRLQ